MQKIAASGEKLKTVGDNISSAGQKLLPVTAGVTALGTAAVTTAANFESAMSQVQATMGLTKDSMSQVDGQSVNTMDTLGKLAKKMGSETAFSASECAQALNYLALAGYDTQEMCDTLPTVLKPTSNIHITKSVEVYADEEMTEPIIDGEFPAASKSKCDLEPAQPFSCDCLVLNLSSDAEAGVKYVGLTEIRLIAEVGQEKTVLLPFLNTAENMEYVNNGYNDDSTFNTEGLDGFMFNGIAANPLYISSNHWIGFGTNSEQLRILRRDGCSTAIYRQLGETTNGLQFLKIRFEGYTAYNNRVDATRLIFELFLLSNNDMFLNVIQTPTNTGYLGTSDMICGGTTTALTLADGSGGGTQVSFYHQDEGGRTWNIVYAMYEETDTYSFAYLVRQADTFYTYADGALTEVAIETLSAAMFLKYGFEEIPPAEILTPIDNMQMYLWKAGGAEELLKANVKAYPYPQVLEAVADMSHISILGIKMMTAEYSGDVSVSVSVDNGQTYSEDMPLGDWLNTDVEELYSSLSEKKRLLLRFTLHDNAAISRFKITYIN